MMISVLAEAGAALQRHDWVAAAMGAAEFLLAGLRSDEGRWLRAWHPERDWETRAHEQVTPASHNLLD